MKAILFSLALFFAHSSFAVTVPLTGTISFLAVGRPAMIKIRGESDKATGQIEMEKSSAGSITVPIDSIKTGIDMRDHHMREKYLESAKFPEAILKFKDLSLKEGDSSVEIPAVFKIHGVEKPVNIKTNVHVDGKTVSAKGNFEIQLSDYGIEIPSYAGIKVADKVEVSAEIKGAKK